MKQIIFVFAALIICGTSFSQTAYRFRKPTVVNSSSWKFSSVASGIDAIVSVVSAKNATVDQIDDSTVYPYAWNPFIRYTNKMNNNSDSSYVEFKVDFKKSSNGLSSLQSKLAMTIVDCDGGTNYKEMVKVSQPATSSSIIGSLLSFVTDSKWLTTIGSSLSLSGIDTSIYIAMAQINYTNVNSFNIKVGVLGKVPANTVRQASFYFKGFSAMNVPLPVELSSFNAKMNDMNAELAWSTASEENLNRFEVCRSIDGKYFSPIGTVTANGNSIDLNNYNYNDYAVNSLNSPVVYYRLKMIDNEGNVKWSNIAQVRTSGSVKPSNVSIFPNPSTAFVNVELTPESINSVSIIDAYGKTVQTMNSEMASGNVMTFDVRNLENGIYFVNVLNSDGSATSSKFIKR